MPNPDPTHPKFLEGDEGLSPDTAMTMTSRATCTP